MRARMLSLLAVVLVVAAAACGGGDDSDAASDNGSDDTTEQASDDTSDDGSDDTSDDGSDDDSDATGDCSELESELAALEETGSSSDPAEAIASLQDAADGLQDAVDSAPDEIQDDVQTLADAFSDIADDLDDLDLDALDDPNDPEAMAEALQALGPMFEAFSDNDIIQASLNIAEFCSGTDLGDLGDVTVPDLGEVTVPDIGDVLGGEGESGNAEAYSDCFNDFEAQGPGDNDGCDTLYDLCEGGDMHACNDLYVSANVGSEYEEYGATCGGRVEASDPEGNGFCEGLD